MTGPLPLFCDESGQTGPNLLDEDQRIFSYAAVAATDEEAWSILAAARRAHGVYDDEIKARDLLKSTAGRAFVLDVLRAVEGRYCVVVYDKLLALCAKVFEYVYEPVFQDDPDLVYAKGLHKFTAMFCYVFFTARDELGEEAIKQFGRFMRSYDPASAPLLFSATGGRGTLDENPFAMVTAFAALHGDLIVADNRSERDALTRPGTLTLDLAISALWSLLTHFGKRGVPLDVTCDRNDPLEAMAGALTGDDRDPGLVRARMLKGAEAPGGWMFARPVRFDDSRNHPAMQIADLAAGACAAVVLGRRDLGPIAEALAPHIHPDAILPDFDVVRLGTRGTDVNWAVLHALGDPEPGPDDPVARLPLLYAAAEAAWDSGELRLSHGGDED